MKRLQLVLLFAVLTTALVFAGSQVKSLPAGRQAASPLPDYGQAPSFSLTERSGRGMTDTDLQGKVWIADFFFTRCSGICPIMTSRMYRLQQNLKKVFLVSFTSDPDYDTPARLSAYADMTHAEKGRWFFLTGKKAAVSDIASGFKFARIDEPMMHSSRLILVDKKGHVRGYYDSEDAQKMLQLESDAKSLTGVS